jgi:hypothetical protein
MFKSKFLLFAFVCVVASVFLFGCTESNKFVFFEGQWVPKYDKICSGCSSTFDCQSGKDFCESIGKMDFVAPGVTGHKEQFFPTKSITCSYTCVSPEIYAALSKKHIRECKGGDDNLRLMKINNSYLLQYYNNSIQLCSKIYPENMFVTQSGDFIDKVSVSMKSFDQGYLFGNEYYWSKEENWRDCEYQIVLDTILKKDKPFNQGKLIISYEDPSQKGVQEVEIVCN